MARQREGQLMSAQKSVSLPEHLWVALDDMSRDGQQSADALMEAAVEQFVALQGYELPRVVPASAAAAGPVPMPAVMTRPSSLQDDDEVGLARTMARSALRPEMLQPEPGRTDMGPPHKPAGEGATGLVTGLAPTHVPSKSEKGLSSVPASTETGPAHVPDEPVKAAAPARQMTPSSSPAPAPKKATQPKLSPAPLWATRSALSDADEERAAARERIAQIDADVEKLTIERPTTRPLGQSEDDGE
ncbi:MAG: hypothetical protein JNK82_02815 [Myxococcaceae bacterium]|nr:hypothetical protein [Myxococcaceae bacterium]